MAKVNVDQRIRLRGDDLEPAVATKVGVLSNAVDWRSTTRPPCL